jgi:hypothetical protein
MKRHFILFVAVLCIFTMAGLVADEAILIDFNKLASDIVPQPDPKNPQKTVNTENRPTMMDFSALAGQSYTEEQKDAMMTSLAVANWEIVLASSSRSNMNQTLSMAKEATVAKDAKEWAGMVVMGLRVRFPVDPFNSWARVQPPFEIPAFEKKAKIDDKGQITYETEPSGEGENRRMTRFEGTFDANTKLKSAFGVVKNVGVIKKVAVNVKGLNFPHAFSVILSDADNNEIPAFMGYLNFDGWRTLTWENPAYVKEVRNRELRMFPLYPNAEPFVKFNSFLVQRDAASEGGDFVAYIRDVKIIYDKALLNPLKDIDDEELWGIIGDRETAKTKAESRRFGQLQVLRYSEGLKQATEGEFQKSEGAAK